MQAYTLYSHVRPFGASVIIGTFTEDRPEIFMIEPSGVYWVRVVLSLPPSVELGTTGYVLSLPFF